MDVFVKTSTGEPGLWYVICHNPTFYLGPYPREDAAFEIREALYASYNHGREEIREGLRELIGAMPNVGN